MKLLAFINPTDDFEFNLVIAWDNGENIYSAYFPTLEAALNKARQIGIVRNHITIC